MKKLVSCVTVMRAFTELFNKFTIQSNGEGSFLSPFFRRRNSETEMSIILNITKVLIDRADCINSK